MNVTTKKVKYMKKVKSAGSKVYEAITKKEAKCLKQVKSAGSKVYEARKKVHEASKVHQHQAIVDF